MILSDSEEKSRTKSNTKEFQSTRDPREFTLITLKIQYVFHTLINSCFILIRSHFGKLYRSKKNLIHFVLIVSWVCGWEKFLHGPIHDNSCFCFFFFTYTTFNIICFKLNEKCNFVLIIGLEYLFLIEFFQALENSNVEFLLQRKHLVSKHVWYKSCLSFVVVFVHNVNMVFYASLVSIEV